MSSQTEPSEPPPVRTKEVVSDNPPRKSRTKEDGEDSKQVSNVPKTSHSEESRAEAGTHLQEIKGEQQPAPNPPRETSNSGAPSVKLDMDLDIEVELKAKIQGDLELAILDGK
ncbi:hypothetical protein AK830_g4183 [Neonectria ditissima]|uniref:Uncharacterized protein n=1 Tax=Neonectria ditissima TaxID=78410 RepID=A0A0P7AWH9_9HYPO|nr:hypothetical protein AK830_g4183 [Neonectria ditissima]